MTDNARRFMAVRKTLIQSFGSTPSRRQTRHLHTLAALVSGIVAAGSTHLPKIAQRVPERSHLESRVKRFARWLANDTLTFETYYMPFAREVARALAERGPLVVVFDGSAMGRGCITLMASVVYRKRALPLLWSVKRGKKGAFSTEEHVALLNQLRQIVPEEAEVIFLGDGEFDALALQRALSEARWSYVCRTSAATRIDDGFTDCALGEIDSWAGERYVSLPRASVTKAGYGPVHVIVWHEAPHREPILLVTNLELAEEALHFYGRRARIETLFSDQKSRGFHVHKSHIADPKRLSRLLMAVALAYLWVIYLGAEALRGRRYRRFHRRDRVDLSLFQLGLRLLEYLLNEGKRILVAFNVPPLKTVR